MRKQNIIQAIVFFLSGLILGFTTLRNILCAIWGAPVHLINFVALVSSLGLIIASILILFRPMLGHVLAILALVGMGTFWLPMLTTLVPTHGYIFPPIMYLYPIIYFIAVGFALLYPKPIKFGLAYFILLILIGVGMPGWIFWHKLQFGEYAYPMVDSYIWQAGGSDLIIQNDRFKLIDDNTKILLMKCGVTGTLRCVVGGSTKDNPKLEAFLKRCNIQRPMEWPVNCGQISSNHIIVIAQQQPVDSPKLYFPRTGKIIYAYTGKKWITIPQDKLIYPAFGRLEKFGNDTVLVYYNWQGNKLYGRSTVFLSPYFK